MTGAEARAGGGAAACAQAVTMVGKAVPRSEDAALVAGQGQFVDDLTVPGLLYAHVVRSPHAHARIAAIDAAAARSAPGVAGVFTADDMRGIGPLPGPPDGIGPALPLLRAPGDRVRWVGEPVALVVADGPARAADAAELVEVDYEPLPAVTDPVRAAAPDAPVLHEGLLAGNVCFRRRLTSGDGGDTAAAFAAARYRVGQRMISQRLAPVALEPRGVLAEPAGDRLHVRIGTQRPHGVRAWLSQMFGIPADAVRVTAGDVGGGFGAKGPLYPDQVAVIAAARLLGRPVKWIEERGESFLATTHGRDQVADLEMAVSADGTILAIRGTVHASMGAYLTPNAANTVLSRMAPLLPQTYDIGSIDVELIGVVANTTPIGPYRGAGRPEAAYYTERLVDLVALETGLDPAEVRRRNFIPPHSGHRTCTGQHYDSGNYRAAFDTALALAGYEELRREQRRARERGQLIGIGMCCFVEPGGIMPGDPGDRATVTRDPSGKVTVAVGTSAHGQGHRTAFAQLAADALGVPFEDVTVIFGDTAAAPFGYGTFGSRSAVAGGTAVVRACQALLAGGGTTATAAAETGGVTFASGSYLCVVEVDPDTGRVRIDRVIAVDDCGRVINPLLVEGQVHGGVAQGVGQALQERVCYDADGQPLSASLLDYAVPAATQVPFVETGRVETLSPLNPLGVKGMGESGTIGVTPAVVNAVMDALRPYGIRHLDMPLTAEKVWTAIQGARQVY
ncbi:MAG TPA: xanthine dehydrogenase family protein molybdopterin-binding subunit [Streptosporangiaceae bacterium]|nr:xanthine dehydrogenase family protein molybdopterin-binding subunit [Streptosporangiaceae bacterium]